MKSNKIIVIGIIGLVVILGAVFGMRFLGGEPSNEGPSIPPNGDNTTACENYRDIPLGECFEIRPDIILEKAVAPAHFEFGNLRPGAWIDSWVKDSRVSISGEDVCYLAGDPLWILLYNGTDGVMTFNLERVNAPLDINHSDNTGKDYMKAPEGLLAGITCPSKVNVDAGMAVKVPITIQFPEGLDYPDLWEFRILVTDLNVPGMVGTAPGVRFFCTMKTD